MDTGNPERRPTRRQMITGLVATTTAVCCADHVGASRLIEPTQLDDSGRDGSSLDPSGLAGRNVAENLVINPRSSWGADLAPRGPMGPEDVRFLLVHHTASSNVVTDPRQVIRGVYSFHTGRQKGWPDVAYNFFVAPDGSVWEGRAGSLDGPVEASATGGNQGFSQLVCLIGNHVSTPPTTAAQTSLVRTLAWLAGRYELDVYADAQATFVSRGSNRYRAGEVITTPIISPHRALTYTACPGDAAVALLPQWRRRVFDTLSATWVRDGLQRARRTGLQPPPPDF